MNGQVPDFETDPVVNIASMDTQSKTRAMEDKVQGDSPARRHFPLLVQFFENCFIERGLSRPSAGSVSQLWSLEIDSLTMKQAIDRIVGWIEIREPTELRFIVTPNIDHLVRLHRQPNLIPMYRRASMTLADGWPLITASRRLGQPIAERVPGSDLLPNLCQRFQADGKELRIFLLGGKPGVPERAANAIHSRWPLVKVVGTSSPPLGFESDQELNNLLCEQINNSRSDLLVVGLGFPKQEQWLDTFGGRLNVKVGMAVGGTIDFLAGEQVRAPLWIQKINLEWLHRLATNPRRLGWRYTVDFVWFPWLCVREVAAVIKGKKR